ncbi:hypothetical protein MUJ63_02280 [Lachnospiraceae bacterium NSJ-143]|nr:hypothetical protein [Lachnospiraceae bacterium NSJ-143]
MEFKMPLFKEPDFSTDRFKNAPDAVLKPVLRDGVAPDMYHATTIFPEYFKVGGVWHLAEESRMDCVAVLKGEEIKTVEFRNLKKGDMVFVGRTENAEEGIFVYTNGFENDEEFGDSFAFRQSRSRETAYSKDYDNIYELLRYEKKHGNIIWVMGPACAFDADSRESFAALVREGYVNGLMAGNALATHDLEASYLKTALGQNIYTQKSQPNGHYNHIDTINAVRSCGSIAEFVKNGCADDGIMYECVRNNVPFVLAGSIRDDGPLPEVYANVYEAQDAMRGLIRNATTVICMASALHTIATGNMTPSFRKINGIVRPVYLYSVDISEFAVNKLKDRGSLSVKTIVTNVQDFVVNVRKGLGIRKGEN